MIGVVVILNLAAAASAIIEVDATSSGVTTEDSIALTHQTSGENRLMLVGISYTVEGTGRNVKSVTYDGIPLNPIGEFTFTNDTRLHIFELIAPPETTADVVVTFTQRLNHGGVVGVVTLTGVNQATAHGAFVASVTGNAEIPSAVDELVFATVVAKDAIINPKDQQTLLWNLSSKTARGAASTKPGAESVTMPWSGIQEGSVGAVSIKPTNDETK